MILKCSDIPRRYFFSRLPHLRHDNENDRVQSSPITNAWLEDLEIDPVLTLS
jgi:hypothetical protein